MIVHQVYAMIDEDSIVQNIMVCDNYEDANRITRAVYGERALAVDCLQYPCRVGDIFRNNYFWNIQDDGTEKRVEYVPTQEQQVQQLQQENNELTVALADMIGGAV